MLSSDTLKIQPKVILTRTDKTDKSTLGIWSLTKSDGFSWVCKTLELPDKGNQQKISCIPVGEYDVIWSFSPSMKKFTYEIINVPGRAGIRIHSANFTKQLLGCIALGDIQKDINGDGTTDILHSGATLEKFEELMNKQHFKLKIQ